MLTEFIAAWKAFFDALPESSKLAFRDEIRAQVGDNEELRKLVYWGAE